MSYDRPPQPAPRVLLALLGAGALAVELVLALVGGWVAAAAGLPVLLAGAIWLACYVGGAEVMDGEHRRQLRLVRQRTLSMLGWSSLVSAARSSSGNFDHAVKPELERLYAVRLAEKHGVSLHAEPERAAALIGPELWPWIDPRRVPAHPSAKRPHQAFDRRTAAPPPPPPDSVLRALVDRLERL
ncbi:MAG TPA: hypothetical protein VH372_02145 [Actinospica sp.]|jgi:hypothetical protein|nr:hypothetical protein [Actinospica sp.]